ncbi:MAG: hypothetical protein EA360_06675 [Balneolaceae bacterium]|nr:MAG: hypothetical protein EA360_06675 [Balneolaceae bacterium]
MSNPEQSKQVLNKLSMYVDLLNDTFVQLHDTMEGQIEAIVSANPQRIEELTEEHSTLSFRYKQLEKDFVLELRDQLKEEPDLPIRLVSLKTVHPALSEKIDHWRTMLTENTNRLQQKHEHVVRLLEFALLRNSNMMRTIYSVHNSKTSHYTLDGQKENSSSGMAINQEI